jgi:hypothetical protein
MYSRRLLFWMAQAERVPLRGKSDLSSLTTLGAQVKLTFLSLKLTFLSLKLTFLRATAATW